MCESHILTLASVFRLSGMDVLANVHAHHHIIISEAISNTQLSNLYTVLKWTVSHKLSLLNVHYDIFWPAWPSSVCFIYIQIIRRYALKVLTFAVFKVILHWVFGYGGDRGGTVVKVLCYKSEGSWFDPRWFHWNFSLTLSFRSHYGPGVDSASNINEYQEDFLGVNAAGA